MLNQYLQGIKKPQVARMLKFFSKSASSASTTSSNNFLTDIDLGYEQLIKVTAPDVTIPIKHFNVIRCF